jgi:DNA-binding GntR family transcriptional regulator
MVESTIPRTEMIAEVFQRLRRLIVEGQLGPGVRLVETELATRFGVSRTPIRTALSQLRQEGFVEALGEGRQSRLTVTAVTRHDAIEIFGIVGEIEGLAARWAAGLPEPTRAALVTQLEQLNAAMAGAATQSPPDALETIRLDTAFHREYVLAGAGRRLRSFHESIKPQADRFIYVYHTTLTTGVIVSTGEHAVIIGAIRDGDAAGAHRAVRSNWENAAARLSTSITLVGERGVS